MTQQELKRLKRADLLEMLVAQSREVEELRSQVASLRKAQSERKIMIDNAGSIAEAALQLNGVFEAAQNSCAQYMENIIRQEEICANMERETAARCEKREKESKEACEQMLADAKRESEAYWEEVSGKMKELVESHAVLKRLISNDRDAFKGL